MYVHNNWKSRREFLNHSMLGLSALAIASRTSIANARLNAEERFQLSLHQYSLKQLFDDGKLKIQNYAEFAKETLGISNIEFAAEFCTDLLASPEKADEIREKSMQIGVTNRALLCADGKMLDARTEKERSEALEEHLKWAKVAERLGCEFMRVRATTMGDRAAQLKNAVTGIGALCDALKSTRVSVLIENITGLSRDPDWLVEVVEKIGPDRVGLIADFGNFDGDIYAGMKRILPHTKSVCTKSWEFDSDGNETKIDFARMMKVITDSKFRGCIAIEYLGKEPVSGVQKTAALVNRYGGATKPS